MGGLTPSLEDYLEAVFRMEREYTVSRVKDIAGMLNVKMPSVIGALKILREKGLVNYRKKSFITLTESGKKLAEAVILKHNIIEDFLISVLSVDPDIAFKEACGMKHVISTDTAIRLRNQFGLNGSILNGIVLLRTGDHENG